MSNLVILALCTGYLVLGGIVWWQNIRINSLSRIVELTNEHSEWMRNMWHKYRDLSSLYLKDLTLCQNQLRIKAKFSGQKRDKKGRFVR